jgi:hypothetical protein
MNNNLYQYFGKYAKHIIGVDQTIETPNGQKKLIYSDWIASGRLYRPIEDVVINLTAIYRYISEILLIFKVWKRMISESYQALSGIVFASVQ